MSQKQRVLGPKVYDPHLAKKILAFEPEHVDQEKKTDEDTSDILQDNVILENNATNEESAGEDIEGSQIFNYTQEIMIQLEHERRRRDICLSKLQELETGLQHFSEKFQENLQHLREDNLQNLPLPKREAAHRLAPVDNEFESF
ncbi:hypothetical protein O6H91_07G083700 [Diphasiastrum complanatum]|uniref:Uncharacterized protein n=2 Tax=Diphasiastrum complanatum TaxID=34168 RepID=A0ACC2D840_DIPCM|nr:hypothetical protein O6H91_07G083700 [Diphasiastrum complanatum]KAJ7550112.1 hypothetical protein O6H91_07G083700 [Diphasiastrum complanatum]